MLTQEQRTKKDIYDQEYKKANYDQIAIRVKKGKREEYQQAAEDFGLGQAEMFRLAIEYFISERRLQEFKPASSPKPESISAADKRLVEEFNQLPVEAQKHFLKAFKAINEVKPAPMSDDREEKI